MGVLRERQVDVVQARANHRVLVDTLRPHLGSQR